jgi:NADH-quinone oxidoreductase subunit C
VQGSARRLSPAELAERLRAQFGDDILGAEDIFGHASITVTPAAYHDVAGMLRDDGDLAFDYFDFLSAVDYQPKGAGFELVFHVYSTRHNHHARVRLALPADEPHAPTISDVWAGANWHERETWELFGIEFDGHPHLVKLVLPEQFEGHPLRKDFALMTREAKPWPGAVEGEEVEE